MTLISDEPDHKYHGQRGLFLTSHRLIAAFKSTADFIQDAREAKADTDALYFGRAAHVHLLENSRFPTAYTVGGPVNPKTGKSYGTKSKKFKEWADAQPLPAITPEEMALIERMTAAVHRKKAAQELLAKGEAEVTGRCEIEGVPCQIRLDWLTACRRIVDYKTTQSLATFAYDCDQYGYLIQQSFYRMVVREITGTECPCYLIGCEKTGDPAAIVWQIKDALLDEQERKNRAKIIELRELFFRLQKEKKCQSEPSSTASTNNQQPHQSPQRAAG